MRIQNTLLLILICSMGLVRAPFLLPLQISGCTNINVSGGYALGSNLVGANITPSNLLTTACILINVSNVELNCSGYTITNNVSGNTTGILIHGSSGSEITNVTIVDCRVSNYSWGMYTYYANQSIWLNNTANLTTNIGFVVHNSSYINLTNNTAYNNLGDGFSSFNSFYNILNNNTAYNSTYGFISQDSSAYNTFTSNTAYNVSVGFYLNYTYNNTFNGDTARNNTWGFIIVGNSSGNNLTSNTAYGSFWHGFLVQSVSNNNLLLNNTAYSNSYEGFYIANSSSGTLINNTAYGNQEDGFLVGNGSSYIVLTNNTAYDNRYSGFEIVNSNNNNLTGNLYNQSPYHSGLLRYGDGFYLQNASNNNITNNTAVNSYIAGFYIYNSSYNSFINNTAINNSWEGFILESSFNNSFTNNLAYANPQFGFEIYLSTGNNLTNNIVQESGVFDLYIDALSWGLSLNVTPGDSVFCNNIIENLTGSGGRPINYSNTSVNWNGITASEIVLCHADGSNLTNVTIRGSDSIQNNGLLLSNTGNTVIDGSNSSRNLVGFLALFSDNNNFTNNIAEGDLFVGFADFAGTGNRFTNNIQSGSIQAGFMTLFSNNSVYLNNTARGNYMAGFAIIDGSNNTSLTNNTVHNTSQVGTLVQNSDFTMITGDHYYANDVDFEVNTSVELAPLNLSGVIFDNPLGNYGDYTNISLNDVVQPNESYAITWNTKPVTDPSHKSSFHNKFINILATPGAVIDNIIWHWTDAEAAGHDVNGLSVMLYSGGWGSSPGQSTNNPSAKQISIANLNGFGIFGIFEPSYPPSNTGGSGGAGCTSNLKASIEPNCPGNNVVIKLTDSNQNPIIIGQKVDLTSEFGNYVGNTDKNGEARFVLSSSGKYTITLSGAYCFEYSFNYEICEGCSSDEKCTDTQYCEGSTGLCKSVGCTCGQAYSHSCHPYACCADTDCNSNYTCVNHECKAPVIGQPECTTNGDCNDDQYCSNGKCFAIQRGKCGRIINHAWEDYECCNNSDCQKGSACINNTCVLYRIITDPSGFLGAQHELLVLPERSYQLDITTPKGVRKIITTDATGHATFVLENAGLYTVSLIKEEAAVNVTVTAISKEQPPTPPVSPQPDLCIPGAIIGIILLLAIIYLAYRKISRS